ncbi:ABC transporter substrate-binding protein [Methylobacterium sp. J-072]|uniref:taurine ABC transporter substrate-binding protein n=1 Tax=Methylobacterium sp. J-072 TaxID=2836651 RepID=UPI001FB871C7|nr:ABC transporter substrate-binding protein [Methylobacterium sp. J-072]MCJ2094514.1 ABC transporter substrate-binding protein [Methylobacterium sp. J-072]
MTRDRTTLSRRRVLALGAGALGTVALPGTGGAQQGAKPSVVRIGYLTAPRAWVIGKHDRAFETALGTGVEWIPFPSGGPALQLLAAGKLDFAIFGSTPIAAGISRGLPIQILGSPEVVATSERLVVRPEITAVKQLEGKRIAVAPSSTMAFALEAVIRINRLDPAKVKRLPLGQPETIAAWKRGDIDGTYINGPFWSDLLGSGGRQLLVSGDLQPHGFFFWNSAVVRTDFAQRYPETVVTWLRTVQAQFDRYRADPEGVARTLAEDFGAPFEAVRDTLVGLSYPTFQEQLGPKYWGRTAKASAAPFLKALSDTADFLAESGEIKRGGIPASFGPFVNYDLLNRAFPA